MSKLKGAKRLQKTINNFTKTFGVTAKWGKEFEAIPATNTIHFTVLVDTDVLNHFVDNAEMRYPEVYAHPFLWLLMHEIGHLMTCNLFSVEEQQRFLDMKDNINEFAGYYYPTVCEWYQILPDEYMATRWAGEYMLKHPKKIKKFCNKLNKEMLIFFKKNEITPEEE